MENRVNYGPNSIVRNSFTEIYNQHMTINISIAATPYRFKHVELEISRLLLLLLLLLNYWL
jgi:hypothetical protein